MVHLQCDYHQVGMWEALQKLLQPFCEWFAARQARTCAQLRDTLREGGAPALMQALYRKYLLQRADAAKRPAAGGGRGSAGGGRRGGRGGWGGPGGEAWRNGGSGGRGQRIADKCVPCMMMLLLKCDITLRKTEEYLDRSQGQSVLFWVQV